MFRFLRSWRRKRPETVRKTPWDELKNEYEARRKFAETAFSHDPIAKEASLKEIETWLRLRVKERIHAPL